jgi:hypothetical protein
MGQSRNKTGVNFEKYICDINGWEHSPCSPKIIWTGSGKSNFEKIYSLNFDVSKFKPTDQSILKKWDAIIDGKDYIEIKKYKLKKIETWKLYSEPIIKIANKATLKNVVNLFGDGNIDMAKTKYNKFVNELYEDIDYSIIETITSSNIGVQLEDIFIPHDELEYSWSVKKGWMGFDRLSIEFRIKG